MSATGFTLVSKGQYKSIFIFDDDPALCIVVSSDRMIAGNGQRLELPGVGALSNTLACNLSSFLVRQEYTQIRLAFKEKTGPVSLVAAFCKMIPLKVVCSLR